MPLVAHLRELRHRVVTSALALVVASAVAWVYYDPLFALLQTPLGPVTAAALEQGRDVTLAFTDVSAPFTFRARVSVYVGAALSSPVWLYQLWAFLTPGLYRRERRLVLLFSVTAVPLFAAGIAVAWVFLPTALALFLGMTPSGVPNIVDVPTYCAFVLRMLAVFGLGFELPVFLVLLNAAGVLPASRLRASWRAAVLGIAVFAAVASPTGDPLSMLFLAVPMLVFYGVALLVTARLDRRRARQRFDDLPDTEPSPLPDAADEHDPRRTGSTAPLLHEETR